MVYDIVLFLFLPIFISVYINSFYDCGFSVNGLAAGSDYMVFLQNLGVSSLDYAYENDVSSVDYACIIYYIHVHQ